MYAYFLIFQTFYWYPGIIIINIIRITLWQKIAVHCRTRVPARVPVMLQGYANALTRTRVPSTCIHIVLMSIFEYNCTGTPGSLYRSTGIPTGTYGKDTKLYRKNIATGTGTAVEMYPMLTIVCMNSENVPG